MWIERKVEKLISRMSGQFPSVLITGARQAGKTSILRHMFADASYLSLDLPANAEAAVTAPEQLLDRYPGQVIIDEIQYAPSLLRYIKNRIDADRSPGKYLLTGSQLFSLMQGVSESLTGRCGIINLYTLSMSELIEAGLDMEESSYVFTGGYPELHIGADTDLWFPSYVATYLERDVRNILRVVDLQDFNRFIRTCALRTSQVLNYSDLARDTGIAPNTARKWLNLLQSSTVVTLIEPYFGNRTKRLIKSPKLVYLDTGLAAFLAGFRNGQDLFASSLSGAFWESHVFGQVIRHCASEGYAETICYWRTVNGQEVDMVIERAGGMILAVECKCKEHPDISDSAGLRALDEAEKGRVKGKYLVCRTKVPYKLSDGTWVMGLSEFLNNL